MRSPPTTTPPCSLSLSDSIKSGCLNGAQMLPIFHIKECIFIYINFSELWWFGYPGCVFVHVTQTWGVHSRKEPSKGLTRKSFTSLQLKLASRPLQPCKGSQARTTQLSCSLIPGPQKL